MPSQGNLGNNFFVLEKNYKSGENTKTLMPPPDLSFGNEKDLKFLLKPKPSTIDDEDE